MGKNKNKSRASRIKSKKRVKRRSKSPKRLKKSPKRLKKVRKGEVRVRKGEVRVRKGRKDEGRVGVQESIKRVGEGKIGFDCGGPVDHL